MNRRLDIFPGSVALAIAIGTASICQGCRTSTIGLPVALVSDSITEMTARRQQGRFIGKPLDDLLAEFGPASDSFLELNSGERFITVKVARFVGKQSFYLIHVSKTDEVLDVQYWIEWHDGFEDSLKLAFLKPKVIAKDVAAAERRARLKPPIMVLARDEQVDRLRIYDVTNWTHIRKRLLILEFTGDGLCADAKYYGIAGDQALRKKPPPHSERSASN